MGTETWVYVNVWPNEGEYADGGWNGIFGPFQSEEEGKQWCYDNHRNPYWLEEVRKPDSLTPEEM